MLENSAFSGRLAPAIGECTPIGTPLAKRVGRFHLPACFTCPPEKEQFVRVLNSFALAAGVAVISLFAMLAQPAGAETIAIHSPDVTSRLVSNVSDSRHAIGDLDSDSRLTRTGESVNINAEMGESVFLNMKRYDLALAFLNGEIGTDRAFTSPVLGQSGSWISATVSTPAGDPAAPILTQDVGLATGNLVDYAWTLILKATELKASTGGENAVASTGSDLHPKIVAASEPNHLACVAGVAAMGSVWQLRRFRRCGRHAAA
jgi:hypothetical protein